MASESIPIAQYLRTSTVHQQYSFENEASERVALIVLAPGKPSRQK